MAEVPKRTTMMGRIQGWTAEVRERFADIPDAPWKQTALALCEEVEILVAHQAMAECGNNKHVSIEAHQKVVAEVWEKVIGMVDALEYELPNLEQMKGAQAARLVLEAAAKENQ